MADLPPEFRQNVNRPSPFVNEINWSRIYWPKQIFMTIFVMPVRLILVVLLYGVALGIAKMQMCYIEPIVEEKRVNKQQRFVKRLVEWILMALFTICGFRVRFKGKRATVHEAPILIMAPHVGFFDCLPLTRIGRLSVLSKSEVKGTRGVNHIICLTQPVLVERESQSSRRATMEKINERVKKVQNSSKGNKWDQVMIYPEATTTNQRQLLQFKIGAFTPGVPIQPITVKWQGRLTGEDYVSFTFDGATALQLIWLTLTRTSTNVVVEYLPVCHPQEGDKERPWLFAERVQKKMAESLGVPASKLSMEACAHVAFNGKNPRPSEAKNLLEQLLKNNAADADAVMSTLTDFSEVSSKLIEDAKAEGSSLNDFSTWNMHKFAEFLKVKHTDANDAALWRLFNLFNLALNDKIDIREFLIAVNCDGNISDKQWLTIEQLYPDVSFESDKEPVSVAIFTKVMRLPLGVTHKKLRDIYNKYSVGEKYSLCDTFDSALREIQSKQKNKKT